MITLTEHLSTRLRRASAPQGERLTSSARNVEAKVGTRHESDHWQRLDRFLTLGVPGGTYYIGEHELAVDSAQSVIACLAEDGLRVVQRALEVSEGGMGSSNDPALFVLAIAASLGDDATWAAALAALPRVARNDEHLARWLEYVNERTTAHLQRFAVQPHERS